MKSCCDVPSAEITTNTTVVTNDSSQRPAVIALAGNPNAGKTTLFNILTGAHQHTGNWPGKTIERKEGSYSGNGMLPPQTHTLVDLPGTYSLSAYSAEEVVAADYLVGGQPDAVIIVIDAANLERNLYLTTQILEMGLPAVVALNMMDTARSRGLTIDVERLSRALGGVPVVPMVARREEGLADLKQRVADVVAAARHAEDVCEDCGCECPASLRRRGRRLVDYGRDLEAEMEGLVGCIEGAPALAAAYPTRWLAIKLLEQDSHVLGSLEALEGGPDLLAAARSSAERIAARTGDDVDLLIPDRRYGFINGLVREVVTRPPLDRRTRSDRLDSVVTHPLLGLPVFGLAMWLIFQVTANVSAFYVDWIDGVISGPLTRWAAALLGLVGLGGTWVESLVLDGAIAGVGGVLVFVPVLAFTYFFIAVLEDTGYMARAAFLMDRFMHHIGLHGKSFIPMLLGFGCNVPGIYATRTLENPKDRILTALLVPFMSCGARLPVYMVIGAAFFGRQAGTLVWAMYVTGVAVAVLIGIGMKNTVFRQKELAPFVIELPPYRIPTVKSVLIHTWERTRSFVEEATTLILIASVIVWVLTSIPVRGGRFAQVDTADSALATVSGWVAPAFQPAGFGSWETTSALVTGFVAKEVIVSTLSVVMVGEEEAAEAEVAPPNFWQDLGEIGASFATATWDTLRGTISLIPGVNLLPAEAEEAVDAGLVAALRGAFTPLAAVAFCIYVLLTAPCVTTMAALKAEFGPKWMAASVGLMLVVAWVAAVLVYQGGLLLGLG